ncbi:uncharacterized protein [Linepithema humile]|uniref:uncharacterized protein n=1 Tax=Linepithema humile TaxID=83485 RepID=UPI00062377D9|nr:PREDICTED: uncharacterized protein LOC105675137 [Linepithema humile]
MRNSVSFVALFVMIETAVSKPLWTTLIDNNYLHSMPEINAQPQYFTAYQNTHSPYYIYNVHTNAGGIPGYNFYYGTPIYDYRIPLSPLSPIYPVLTPSQPGLPPRPLLPPTSTQPSEEDDYDGIEKLDMKVDPNEGTKKPENNENDSIVVDAI